MTTRFIHRLFVLIAAFAVAVAGALSAMPQASAEDGTTYNVEVKGGTADKTEVAYGDTVTITANQEEGKGFVQWTSNNEDVEFDAAGAFTTTFVMPDNPVTITAIYADIKIAAIDDQMYTGDEIEPRIGLSAVGLEGVDGIYDFTVKYSNNINAGIASATVTLKQFTGSYVGTKTVNFNILAADISNATVTVPNQVYGGRGLEPNPTVKWDGQVLVNGTDYTVAYRNNVRVGQASADVVGKGNFEGTLSATFTIAARPLTVTADSAERAYDATSLTADSFLHEGLADGDRIVSADVVGSQTEVGSSDNIVSNAKIANSDGEDVTDCYVITYKPGTLTVVPVSYDVKDSSGNVLQSLTWQKGSGKTVDFTVNRSEDDDLTFGKFVSLAVDGKPVGEQYYLASSGSLNLSIKPEFLETLTVGDHDVVVDFADGSVTLKLTVLAADLSVPESPAAGSVGTLSTTGADIGSPIALALLVFGLGAGLLLRSKRRTL